MEEYKVYLKHDQGNVAITLMAWSVADAIRKVCYSELAPQSAIDRVTRVEYASIPYSLSPLTLALHNAILRNSVR